MSTASVRSFHCSAVWSSHQITLMGTVDIGRYAALSEISTLPATYVNLTVRSHRLLNLSHTSLPFGYQVSSVRYAIWPGLTVKGPTLNENELTRVSFSPPSVTRTLHEVKVRDTFDPFVIVAYARQ